MVRQTSLETYAQLQEECLLSPMRQKVYNHIKHAGIVTDSQISTGTMLPINCVTPRRGELVRLGLIKNVGITHSVSGRPTIQWSVV